jgi:phosphoribosylaminoimidazole-succinocarboxamide synthase
VQFLAPARATARCALRRARAGAVLNGVSAWWMRRTAHIVRNALVSTPHPALAVMRRCPAFRIEFVVRAYLTGTTSTSVWTHYAKGSRVYCGHALPDGLAKNAPLP